MKNFHNIEGQKLGSVKFGTYRVGYDRNGNVWHIRGEHGAYKVIQQHSGNGYFTSATLSNVSEQLSKIG